jgi:hypothetical protein
MYLTQRTAIDPWHIADPDPLSSSD